MDKTNLQNIKEEKDNLQELETQLLIIGAGPGGYISAIYAAKSGLDVTLVEKEELGGTCLNVGCIPTKALIQSSEVYKTLNEASTFGISQDGELSVDMDKVIDRKDQIRKRLVNGIDFLMKKNKITVIKGEASFISPDEISLVGENNYKIRYKNAIIATGSKISKVNIPGVNLPFVMNSSKALSNRKLPKSITIIGGGVIGMEFAFLYRNFGVEVNVIEFMDRVLSLVDEEVSKEINRAARKARIKIVTSAKVTEIKEDKDKNALVVYENKKGQQSISSQEVLIAIGREPNLDGLNIENAGIQRKKDGRGIAVDDSMRTNAKNIYAIGDVNDIMQLAHVASDQGIIAVKNILGEKVSFNKKAVPNVIFTSPEVATVGLSEKECKEMNIDYSVSKMPFISNGKAIIMNQTDGFTKIIKDDSNGNIIGASIIGPDASTLINTFTLAVDQDIKDMDLVNMIFPHPTTGEVIHEAASEFEI